MTHSSNHSLFALSVYVYFEWLNWLKIIRFANIKNSTFVDFSSSSESMHQNRNKCVDKNKSSFEPSSSMLKNIE